MDHAVLGLVLGCCMRADSQGLVLEEQEDKKQEEEEEGVRRGLWTPFYNLHRDDGGGNCSENTLIFAS